jgi:hypothetical protein
VLPAGTAGVADRSFGSLARGVEIAQLFLLQIGVLGFGVLENRYVGIGMLPEREKVSIGGLRIRPITRRCFSLPRHRFALRICAVAIDSQQLSVDASVLRHMMLDLIAQLDVEQARRIKTERVLQQLLEARGGRKSEQLSPISWRCSPPN